nr:unnamed protein product [Spirometra erinaceieuropaei]
MTRTILLSVATTADVDCFAEDAELGISSVELKLDQSEPVLEWSVIAPLERFWWNSTLLEAGLLATILAFQLGKRRCFSSYPIVAFSVKWLLFRISVSAGLAKLSQQDSEWWSLGALKSHFDSQLLPTPIAWYAAAIPDWVLRLVGAYVLMMHLIVPVLFLIPLHGVQLFCFYSEMLLHTSMLLCGNYGFDSALMISLCCVLRPTRPTSKKGSTVLRLMSTAASLSLISVVLYISAVFFGVRLSGNKIDLNITVPYEHFRIFARDLIRYSVPIAFAIFGLTLLYSIYMALRLRGCMRKVANLTVVLLTGFAAAGLFLGSSASFVASHEAFVGRSVSLPDIAHELARSLRPLHLANDYRALFMRDKKVFVQPSRTGRATLVFEGSMSEKGPWTELSFFASPSKLNRMPPVLFGHSPVVDFELALDAYKSFDQSPLLSTIVYRILTQQKDVKQLMDLTGLPAGPKYIQVKLYDYHFTQPNTSGSNWWRRTLRSVYLPPTHATDPRLAKMVEKSGIVGRRRERPVDPTYLSFGLDQLRSLIGQPRDITPFIGVVLAVLVLDKLVL